MKIVTAAALGSIAILWGGPVLGQSAPAAGSTDSRMQQDAQQSDSGGIEDIVVTARRVSENMQRTPVAVTALSSEALTNAQLTNVSQLQSSAPGLTMTIVPAQPGSTAIFMRGQGSTDGLIAVDQSIGTYVDGVYAARSTGGAFDLVDVARIEVLRGPQGTLFGRNTNGGAINVISHQPTGKFEALQRVDLGNYDAFLSQTVLNLPLAGEEAAFRVAYQHRQHGSYGFNRTLNRGLGSDNTDFVRASLKLAPAALPFSVLVQGDYTDGHSNGLMRGLKGFTQTPSNAALVAACGGAGSAAVQAACPVRRPGDTLANYVYGSGIGDLYTFENDRAAFARSKSYGIAATVEWPLTDDLLLKSITAWRGVDLKSVSDSDGTPYIIIGVVGNDFIAVSQDQFSQELQLTGKTLDDRLSFIFGGFYFVENGRDYSPGGSLFPLSPVYGVVDADVRNRSIAGYGQATFALSDTVRLTGGARYTEDQRGLVIRNLNRNLFTGAETPGYLPTDGDPADPFRASFRRRFHYISYTLNGDWEAAPGLFFYAKTNRGWRAGGLNTRAVTGGVPPISFSPEKLTDYEAGAKLDAFDRRMRFNIAVYRADLQNLQRPQSGLFAGRVVSGVVSGATARVQGIEAELTLLPFEGMTLGGSLALTDAKYKRFINLFDGTDLSDTPFPLTPKQTYALNADYEHPISGVGTLRLHGDVSYRTKTYYQPTKVPTFTPEQNRALIETAKIPGYSLVNVRLALHLDRPDVELATYARNLTKERYFLHLLAFQHNALGITSYTPGDPRTYGISATYRF